MSSKQGGKAKPLKQPKAERKEYDEMDGHAGAVFPSVVGYPAYVVGMGDSQQTRYHSRALSSQPAFHLHSPHQGSMNAGTSSIAPEGDDVIMVVNPIEMRKGKKKKGRGNGTPNKRWDKDMDAFLIPFLVEQANKGMKVDKTFKRPALIAAAEAVSKKFGVNMSANNVENHMTWIKKKFGDIIKARKLSGVEWDDEKKMIIMEPKTYKSYIAGHSHMRNYINQPIPFFEELRIICGEDFAIEERMKSFDGKRGAPMEQSDAIDLDSEDDNNVQGLKDATGVELLPCPTYTPIDQANSASSRRSTRSDSKRSRSEQHEDMVDRLCDGITVLADSITRGPEHWSDKLAKAVMSLEGFDDSVLARALDELIVNETRARSFIIRPPRMREQWMKEFAQARREKEANS